jgi:acetamidase/formamidase
MQYLQPHTGPIPSDHYLPAVADEVLWGWLPNAATPARATIDNGETITIDTLSHEGLLEDQGRAPVPYLAQFGVERPGVLDDAVAVAGGGMPHDFHDGPHVVTGPIHVKGARVGDLLKIDVLDLAERVPYGFISSRHGYGALPGEFPEHDDSSPVRADDSILSMGSVSYFCSVHDGGSGRVGRFATGLERPVQFQLAPFLGIMGVAPSTDQPVPSVPPGRHGGNMDIKHLVQGSTLYLPVAVDGAMFYAGDPHFAQGNGEVALTALEASLRATVRLAVISGADAPGAVGSLTTPFVETSEHWIPTGMDEDLDEAMKKAVRAAIDFLHTRVGLPRAAAYAYLSAAGDFEVSQVVDSVKGVHCMISKADFAAWT